MTREQAKEFYDLMKDRTDLTLDEHHFFQSAFLTTIRFAYEELAADYNAAIPELKTAEAMLDRWEQVTGFRSADEALAAWKRGELRNRQPPNP